MFVFNVAYLNAKSINILFIGNSLTYSNNMLQMLKEMINERKINMKIDNITPGGFSLANHIKTNGSIHFSMTSMKIGTTTKEKILSEHWDIVVLQEATLVCLIPEEREYSSEPAIKILDQTIKDAKAKTVLFQLYTCQEYPVKYCHSQATVSIDCLIPIPHGNLKNYYCSDSFRSSSDEFHVIETFYNKIGKKIGADIVKIGYGFELCKKKYPEITLYESKSNDHPSKEGAYLIACMFLKYFTKTDIEKIKYSGSLNVSEARKLRKLSNQIK